MTVTLESSRAAKRLMDGYFHKSEMAAARGVVVRTLRAERQRGEGPPFIRLNKQIYYSEAGFREWLKVIERRPVRAQKRA